MLGAMFIKPGMCVRFGKRFDGIHVASVLCKRRSLDAEDPLRVPAHFRDEPYHGPSPHHTTTGDANNVLVAARRSAEEDATPPCVIQVASKANWHEPPDLLTQFTKTVATFFTMQTVIRRPAVSAIHKGVEEKC